MLLYPLIGVLTGGVALFVLVLFILPRPSAYDHLQTLSPNIDNGNYLIKIAGCAGCHTSNDGANSTEELGGGYQIKTEFGTFITPNISSDHDAGMGAWSINDFANALKHGITPDKSHLYPAFPYQHYHGMDDQDIVDIFAALKHTEPSQHTPLPNDLVFPVNLRFLQGIWKFLYLDERLGPPYQPKPPFSDLNEQEQALWRRGQYLVEHVTHCGACHSGRFRLGSYASAAYLKGARLNNHMIPDISAMRLRKKGWTADDIAFALQSGITLNGDVFGKSMGEYVNSTARHLSNQDALAIGTYLIHSHLQP